MDSGERNETVGPPLLWKYDAPCTLRIAGPSDIAALLAPRNITVFFIGDSTSRGLMNDVALWAAGCPHRRQNVARELRNGIEGDASAVGCGLIVQKAWEHALAVVPFSGVGNLVLGFFSALFARTQMTTSKYWPSLMLQGVYEDSTFAPHQLHLAFNVGHWNLRFGECGGSGEEAKTSVICPVIASRTEENAPRVWLHCVSKNRAQIALYDPPSILLRHALHRLPLPSPRKGDWAM